MLLALLTLLTLLITYTLLEYYERIQVQMFEPSLDEKRFKIDRDKTKYVIKLHKLIKNIIFYSLYFLTLNRII